MKRRLLLKSAAAGLLYPPCQVLAATLKPIGALPVEPPAVESLDAVARSEVQLEGRRLALLNKTVKRLRGVQKTVGYGNFSLLGFDDALRYARNYSNVGRFTRDELDFLEEIFFEDASRYGFYGAKVLDDINAKVPPRDAHKVPGSGHFLYKGKSLQFYNKLRRDTRNAVVLTSGIRGIVKQMYLFLNKAKKTGGNLSQASHSLAPPGHSYHGVGDFDVGKPGFGYKNFTEAFAHTDEFKRLIDLGYVLIRYPSGNPYGVRFEPWHIKVV